MKKRALISISLCIILLFNLVACSSAGGDNGGGKSKGNQLDLVLDGDEVLEFKDKELERLIKDTLEIETDEILVEYLEDLKRLEIKGNEYEVKDLYGLQYAVNLYDFKARDINIKSLDPILKLEKLESIMFWDGEIEEQPMKVSMPSLTDIEINNTNLSDFSFLDGSTAKYVTLRDNTATSITFAKNMQNLVSLDLFNNNVSDLSPLEDKEDMDFINFENNQVSDISVLATLTGLISAILTDNDKLVELDALVDHPSLEALTFLGFKGDMAQLEKLEEQGIRLMY